VSEQSRQPTIGLIAEQYGPALFAVLIFMANDTWFRFYLGSSSGLGQSSVGPSDPVGLRGSRFLGDRDHTVHRYGVQNDRCDSEKTGILRRGRALCFCEALFATFLLLLGSVIIEPLSGHVSPLALSSAWLAVALWTLLTTLRTFVMLSKILSRMES